MKSNKPAAESGPGGDRRRKASKMLFEFVDYKKREKFLEELPDLSEISRSLSGNFVNKPLNLSAYGAFRRVLLYKDQRLDYNIWVFYTRIHSKACKAFSRKGMRRP